jgi:hypothetical protein
MKDAIDFEQHWFHNVMADQLEIRPADQMGHVMALATEKIVEADYFMPFVEQPLA